MQFFRNAVYFYRIFSNQQRLSVAPRRCLICNGNAVFAAELAKFFHSTAYGFSISRNTEQMLADHPARNTHNLGDFPLGLAVFEIQNSSFKLSLRKRLI